MEDRDVILECLNVQQQMYKCRILGYAVVQLVEALCYKLEGHGFDSRWCHCNFLLT
jgi:hypothetical protein